MTDKHRVPKEAQQKFPIQVLMQFTFTGAKAKTQHNAVITCIYKYKNDKLQNAQIFVLVTCASNTNLGSQ